MVNLNLTESKNISYEISLFVKSNLWYHFKLIKIELDNKTSLFPLKNWNRRFISLHCKLMYFLQNSCRWENFLQYIPYQLRTQRDIINNFYTFFDVILHTCTYIRTYAQTSKFWRLYFCIKKFFFITLDFSRQGVCSEQKSRV